MEKNEILLDIDKCTRNLDMSYLQEIVYPKELYNYLDKPKPKVVLVLGGPGSGKGTQSKLLCSEMDIVHLSIGDILRGMKDENSFDGKVVKFWLDEFELTGKLMPLEITFRILFLTFIKYGWNDKNYLVDGFIKDFSIMKKWDLIIEPVISLKLAIFYSVELETMRKRVLKRSLNENRGDENIIEKRIECFIKRTIPAIEIIRKKGCLVEINGEQDLTKIQEDTRVAYLKVMFGEN